MIIILLLKQSSEFQISHVDFFNCYFKKSQQLYTHYQKVRMSIFNMMIYLL